MRLPSSDNKFLDPSLDRPSVLPFSLLTSQTSRDTSGIYVVENFALAVLMPMMVPASYVLAPNSTEAQLQGM